MPLREPRVIKVLARIVKHPQLFHHLSRADVCGNRKRNNTLQPKLMKAVTQDLARAFCRQSATPVLSGESPADLDRWHKGSVERRHRETDKPDENPLLAQLGCEEPEAVLFEVPINATHQLIRFLSIQPAGHELH